MKQDKVETPKIIAVVALGAVLLGYVGYTAFGKKASAAAAPTKPPAVVEQVVEQEELTPQVESSEDQTQQVAQQALMLAAVKKKDPFAACVAPEQFEPRPVHAAPQPAPLPRVAALPPLSSTSRNVDIGIKPIPFSTPEPRPEPEPDPQFVLTGIINGSTNVAIIRAGSAERYIVKEGQFINGQYLVKSVKRDGVVLMRGNRSIYLMLGGGTNAS